MSRVYMHIWCWYICFKCMLCGVRDSHSHSHSHKRSSIYAHTEHLSALPVYQLSLNRVLFSMLRALSLSPSLLMVETFPSTNLHPRKCTPAVPICKRHGTHVCEYIRLFVRSCGVHLAECSARVCSTRRARQGGARKHKKKHLHFWLAQVWLTMRTGVLFVRVFILHTRTFAFNYYYAQKRTL